MIPKVIHYCWFGGKPLPKLARKCIASWKKYCPDYEIIEWNENNFDVNKCLFSKEAYREKSWAFLSDVARLFIIWENGGVYLDTDVELISSIDHLLSANDFFFGIETQSGKNGSKLVRVATGLGFAASPGNKIIKSLLDEYTEKHFVEYGIKNTTPCPIVNSRVLEKYGFDGSDKVFRFMGGTIYSSDYFCPKEYKTNITHFSNNTVSVHHYGESWVTGQTKYWMILYYRYKKKMPDGISHFLASYFSYLLYYGYFRGHFKLIKKLVVPIWKKLNEKIF